MSFTRACNSTRIQGKCLVYFSTESCTRTCSSTRIQGKYLVYYIRKNYWCHLDAPKLVWWQLIDITLLVMIYEKTLLNITFSLLHMNNKCLKTYLKYLTGNCQSKFLK